MSSKIEQCIDDIEEYIESCKPALFSSSKIIVDKGEMDDFLRELRSKTPEEIKRYQKIISQKEAILADARQKAEALIAEATATTNQLISEHEIMQQAYAQANEVVTMATRQAQETLDNAIIEANNLRMSAMQYMDDILAHLEEVIAGSTRDATADYEALLGHLGHYAEIIASNRAELHPIEEDMTDTGTIPNIPDDAEEE